MGEHSAGGTNDHIRLLLESSVNVYKLYKNLNPAIIVTILYMYMQQLTFGCEQVECWRHQLSSPHESSTKRDPVTICSVVQEVMSKS
jgi:hypothetical protein